MTRVDDRLEQPQGTLDMLILKTLLLGCSYGRGIANQIRHTSPKALAVEHGSLYPALHRLERVMRPASLSAGAQAVIYQTN